MQLIESLSFNVARLTKWIVVAAAAVMMASLVLQIIFRYLVGSSLVWSEELALFLFTWVILLTGSLGVREGFHVRLMIVRNVLPEGVRKVTDALTHLVAGVFGGLVVYSGYHYLDSTLGQVSAAVRYPIEYLHAAAPVCGALIVLHVIANLADMIPSEDRALNNE